MMGSKRVKATPPLDDPRWQPVREEYKLLSHRTGDPQLALIDLNEALANGGVRSMRRHLKTGKREQLSSKFWRDRVLYIWQYQSNLFVSLSHRGPPGRVEPIDDFVFFVWHPDVATVWPALREADHEVMPQRVKPGTKPRGDWHTLVAAWLIAVALDDPKRLRNIDALVTEATVFLEQTIEWAPAEPKHLRKKIRELLQLLPR